MNPAEDMWKSHLRSLGEYIKAQRQINQLTQRELAAVLLGEEAAAACSRADAPSLRTRAQRLAKGARALAEGGYRGLLAR